MIVAELVALPGLTGRVQGRERRGREEGEKRERRGSERGKEGEREATRLDRYLRPVMLDFFSRILL